MRQPVGKGAPQDQRIGQPAQPETVAKPFGSEVRPLVNRGNNSMQEHRQILENLDQMIQRLQRSADASGAGTVLDPLADAVFDIPPGHRKDMQLRREVLDQIAQGNGGFALCHGVGLEWSDDGLQTVAQLRGAEGLGNIVIHPQSTAAVQQIGVDAPADEDKADPRRGFEVAQGFEQT